MALGIIAAHRHSRLGGGSSLRCIVVYYFNWHLIFWLNIPICVLAFLLIWRALRGIPQETNIHKIDWVGVALHFCCAHVSDRCIGGAVPLT